MKSINTLMLDKTNMKEVTHRFFEILDHKGLSGYAYNRLNPNISTQKISNFKTGRNNITLDVILSISTTFPDINLDWILTGKGNMLKDDSHSNEAVIASPSFMRVPLVPIHAQAGFLNGYGDQVYMDELPSEYWEVSQEHRGNYVCFEVRGDSMDDESSKAILDGDKILTREVQRHLWVNKLHLNKWNFVIVHKEEGIIVKKIVDHNVDNGVIKCHSLNPFYEDFELNLNDVVALFNVVNIKRKPLL